MSMDSITFGVFGCVLQASVLGVLGGAHLGGTLGEQLKVREIRRNRSNHNVISLGESQGIAKHTCDPEGRVTAHFRVLWLVAGICAGRKH